MNKLSAILPAAMLSACVSMGALAQTPAPTAGATPVMPAVAASAPGVKPVEVKPAVVSTVGPAAAPPASDKASSAPTVAAPDAKAKSSTTLHAKAGHRTVRPKAPKATATGGATIK